MGASQEKVTVGISSAGEKALEEVMDTPWFGRGIDAFRVAVALAVTRGLRSDREELGGLTTKYNVGSLDPTGQMASLVRAFYPGDAEEDLYGLVEEFADAGLRYMAERLKEDDKLGEILSEVEGAKTPVGKK